MGVWGWRCRGIVCRGGSHRACLIVYTQCVKGEDSGGVVWGMLCRGWGIGASGIVCRGGCHRVCLIGYMQCVVDEG